MKNVCFLNSMSFWGGGEKLHFETAYELKRRGYNILVLAKEGAPFWKKAIQNDIDLYPIKVSLLSFLNPFKIFCTVRILKNNHIDTIVFSSSQDLKLGCVAAKLAGVKNIVYLRGLAVPIKARFFNIIIFKYFLTHIIANSVETKRTILKFLYKYVPEERVKIIYHGIHSDPPSLGNDSILNQIKRNTGKIVLGNASRLTKQKGHVNLLKIAKILKDKNVPFTLYIAGTGILHDELTRIIELFDLKKEVFLLGFISDMDAFMNSIDVFLLTSDFEGFGYVLVEAMSKSKPVVAFNISSNPEIIKDKESGFLVEYLDIEMFASKTIELINNVHLREEMGQNGKKLVLSKFLLDKNIADFETLMNNSV